MGVRSERHVRRDRRVVGAWCRAGFGGSPARGLLDEPVDVVLVDANNFHTFQPLLYQVATAGLDADDVSYPVRGSCGVASAVAAVRRERSNVEVLMARVSTVSTSTRGWSRPRTGSG